MNEEMDEWEVIIQFILIIVATIIISTSISHILMYMCDNLIGCQLIYNKIGDIIK